MSESDSSTHQPELRQLSGIRAFFAGLVGLGYLYVGRFRSLAALILSFLALVATLSWTKLIFNVWVLYFLVTVGLAIILVMFIHPILIAIREKRATKKFYNHWLIYVLWVIGSSLALDPLTEYRGAVFGYDTFRIPAVSMAPALEPIDVIMVDTWRYRKRDPEVGDIVVFRASTGVDYVKRIIGLPGDQIAIRNSIVYRNGQPMEEPYLHAFMDDRPYRRNIGQIELGESEYYVLGDFRDNSIDSRMFGPISADQIRGRVKNIWFSFSNGKIQWQRFPAYF